MQRVTVVDHPAVADRLARIRDVSTTSAVFRTLLGEIGAFLAYEATRLLPVHAMPVRTPLASTMGSRIVAPPVVAPILRAGLGLLSGFLSVIDDAVVAHLGFFRDPTSLAAVPYYANLPDDLRGARVFVLDPMLATGNSAAAALALLEERGARDVSVLCAIAAREGVARLSRAHPGVRVYACAIDETLDAHGYIVPGLGDAGDRMFGSATSVPSGYRPR